MDMGVIKPFEVTRPANSAAAVEAGGIDRDWGVRKGIQGTQRRYGGAASGERTHSHSTVVGRKHEHTHQRGR